MASGLENFSLSHPGVPAAFGPLAPHVLATAHSLKARPQHRQRIANGTCALPWGLLFAGTLTFNEEEQGLVNVIITH